MTTAHAFDIAKLELVMELTAQINSKLEPSEILRAIMRAAKHIMEAEASSLFLIDEETEDLVLSVPTGPATAELSNKRMPKGTGIAGWVVDKNTSQIISDITKDERFGGDVRSDLFTTRNMICVPMCNQDGKVMGALQAINTQYAENDKSEILSLFEALANQAAISITNARLKEEQVKQELMQRELQLAETIQSGFWPKSTPEIAGFSIAGTSLPAAKVGGDYYDFIAIPNTNKYAFVVADVSGKGVPAALLMATVRAVLRAESEHNQAADQVIQKVNKAIFRDSPPDKFITMFYAELDPDSGTITCVNAGHNPPYVIDASGENLEMLTDGGVMLGVLPEMFYQSKTLKLEKGQTLTIFSDGITEARNADGEFYEEERFEKWLKENANLSAKEMLEKLMATVLEFQGNAPQFDDITAIMIKAD